MELGSKVLTQHREAPRAKRGASLAAAALCIVAVILAARSVTYTAWYQEWIYSRWPLERLAEAASAQPGNAILLYRYGAALNAKGRYTDALPVLEHAAGLEPDNARIRGEWSTAQLAGGYITGAFGQLTEFARTHPSSADGHMLLGRFYVAQSSYVRAIQELEQAVRLNPRLGEAWSLLAGARQQMGAITPAREAAQQAVMLRPDSAVDHMLLASLLLVDGNRSSTRSEYAKAADLAPNNPGYLREYAHVLLTDAKPADLAVAERLTRRAVALDPQTPGAHYDLGRALVLEGKTEVALGPLTTAATLLPPGTPRSTLAANTPDQFLDPQPAQELARAYRKLGRTGDAERWERAYLVRRQQVDAEHRLADAIRDHPQQPELRRKMARLLARRGDVDGVARNLARAMNSAPDAPKVLVETSNALSAAGYGQSAVPLARRAVTFSSASPAAYEAWGNGLLAMGRAHEAATEFSKAAGWWTARLPLYRRAIADYYRQRRLHPSEAEKLYQQALALDRSRSGVSHNVDQVKLLLRRAVELEPENTDYRRAMLRVLVHRHELPEAERAARDLLALSPEDGLGNAMLAVILLEKSGSDLVLPEVEAHLAAASEDATVHPTVLFGQGIVALRKGNGREAVRLLHRSASEDPADMTYYQLAQAERMAGNMVEAARIIQALESRRRRNGHAIARLVQEAGKEKGRE